MRFWNKLGIFAILTLVLVPIGIIAPAAQADSPRWYKCASVQPDSVIYVGMFKGVTMFGTWTSYVNYYTGQYYVTFSGTVTIVYTILTAAMWKVGGPIASYSITPYYAVGYNFLGGGVGSNGVIINVYGAAGYLSLSTTTQAAALPTTGSTVSVDIALYTNWHDNAAWSSNLNVC